MLITNAKKVVFLSITLLSFGCASQKNKPRSLREQLQIDKSSDSPKNNSYQWSAELFKRDFDILKYTLEEAYIGKYILASEFQELIADLEALKVRVENGESKENTRKSLIEIFDFFPDNHLSLIDPKKWKELHQAIPNAHSFKTIKTKKNDTLVITLSSFASLESESWQLFRKDLKANLKRAPRVIIDVRTNIGGDLRSALDFLYILYGLEGFDANSQDLLINTPMERVKTLNNKAATTLVQNMQSFLSGDQANYYTYKFPTNVPVEGVNVGDLEFSTIVIEEQLTNRYRGAIYVLTSKFCLEACEFFALSMHQYPKARIVGQKTNGSIHFANLGLLQLPNSKFVFTIPTSYLELKNGEFYEQVGVAAKSKLKPSTDSLKLLIKKLGGALE